MIGKRNHRGNLGISSREPLRKTRMTMCIETKIFRPGLPENREAAEKLDLVLAGENPDRSYSGMMRFRLSGRAFPQCRDTYFIALDSERDVCVARLWYGWGNHEHAVGNFGNFMTDEHYRRRGIGSLLLDLLGEDLNHHSGALPSALFCTAGDAGIAEVYHKRYGFRPILPGRTHGHLYCPLGNSPDSFEEFCQEYYNRADGEIHFIPGTVAYRHEIDCLLRFALSTRGEVFGLPGIESFEEALLSPEKGVLECALSDSGVCVGWAFTPKGGVRRVQLYPGTGKQKKGDLR